MLKARTQLAAKIEAQEGTAETLAGTDAFLAMNPSFKPAIEVSERDNLSASLSQWAAVPGKRSAVIEFDMELKGSGAAGTAPALGKMLKACGFGETVVTSVSVTYLPASASISSMTMAMYMDGIIKKIWGARGNVSLKLEDGKPAIFHFTFTGADFSVLDGALLSSGVSYEATIPTAFQNASLTLDTYAALLGNIEINMNNEVALREDVNASSGHKSAVITKRKPTMSIDPEFVTVATYDFYGKLRSGALGAATMALSGGVGNICTITAPKVQYVAVNPADKGGINSLGIDCKLNRNAGDDEVSLAYT